MSLVSLLIVVIVIPLLIGVISDSLGPVSRQRVAKFARRQELLVTADNGNAVIAYLATTRRWRATGLTAGFVTSVAWSFGNGFSINVVQLIAGWFAGALIAEWRISRLPVGARRAASLEPRLLASYVSRTARAVPLAFAGVSVVLVAVCATVRASGHSLSMIKAGTFCALALGLVAVGRVVQTRIVDRPQPLAALDVLAADDAIRSRSLRVLIGAIGTLTAYCVVAQLDVLSGAAAHTGAYSNLRSCEVGIGLLGTFFGRAMGTSRWSVRRTDAAVPVS